MDMRGGGSDTFKAKLSFCCCKLSMLVKKKKTTVGLGLCWHRSSCCCLLCLLSCAAQVVHGWGLGWEVVVLWSWGKATLCKGLPL